MTLKDRIEGRLTGESIADMITPTKTNPIQEEAYWKAIILYAQQQINLPPEETKKKATTHMSDQEASRFERQVITFGMHSGVTYGECPIDYLLWLYDSSEKLSTYLRSDKGQERQDETNT